MSKQFLVFIKVISFILGIGYFFFVLWPIIGNLIFTIGMGEGEGLFSLLHIVMYGAILVSVVVVILLIKTYKTETGNKVIYLFLILLSILSIFHISYKKIAEYERNAFEERKINLREESESFLREHCTASGRISGVTKRPFYDCDDGSTR